jgi:hypothetical protein
MLTVARGPKAHLQHHLELAGEREQSHEHGAEGQEEHLKEEKPVAVLRGQYSWAAPLLPPEQTCARRKACSGCATGCLFRVQVRTMTSKAALGGQRSWAAPPVATK